MYLHRKDIDKILDVLKKFPDVETFEIEQSNHSGIGSITTMTFSQTVNETECELTVEISGVEDW
jgi:hypothetical protein